MKIVIIGAGIGGIAIAGRLAKAGHAVTVFEKNATPGGRAQVIQKDGFRFDTGPTLFLMPEIYRETYAALGERMEDHLELVCIDPTYRIHFHNSTHLDLSHNLLSMREQLEAIETGAFAKFLEFMAEGYRHYSLTKVRWAEFLLLSRLFLPTELALIVSTQSSNQACQKHRPIFQRSPLTGSLFFPKYVFGS